MDDVSAFKDLKTGPSFFDLYMHGRAAEAAIGDFIDAWHDAGEATGQSLSAFLGMTWDEYSIWVMDSRSLPLLRGARQSGEPLRGAVGRHVAAMQAAHDPRDRSALFSLSHWLGQPMAP